MRSQGVDPFRPWVVTRQWMRWSILGAIVAGSALWWATGHWQWIVTLLAAVLAAARGALLNETVEILAAPKNAKWHLLHARMSERVADWAATVVLAAGLVFWAWTGWWWPAVMGVVLCAATWLVTTLLQDRRNEALIRAADASLTKGIDLGEQGRDEEAIAEYRRIVAEFGDDPRGRMREYVAIAWFNLAGELVKLGRNSDAFDAYGQVISMFRGDMTPKVKNLVFEAKMQRRRMDEAGHA